ncbi:sensor histidine kinase [Chryseobacterium sp. SN22]|uniref:sensor histidine kinase n=1 Tax=Chryseobacterium sp. SN22 TaxID=2606431 RepID=UPI001628F761|nr:histidine kinase [Chryseobacterium sp. SN22]
MKNIHLLRMSFCRFAIVLMMWPVLGMKAQSSPSEKMANLGYTYRFTDTVKSKKLLADALALAKSTGSKRDEVVALALSAFAYRKMHQVKKFSSYAEQAYKISSVTDDEYAKAYGYMAIGGFKAYFDDKAEALNYRLQAYTLFKKLHQYAQCAQIGSDISYLFSQGSNKKIRKYAYEALYYAEKSRDPESILHARLAVGSYLSQIADKNRGNDKLWKDAVKFQEQTAAYAGANHTKISSKSNLAISHINLASLYIRRSRLMDRELLLKELDSAESISKKYSVKITYGNSVGIRGQYFMLNGEYEKARAMFLEGIAYQHSLPYPDDEMQSNLYQSLKEIAAAQKDYASYYLYDQSFGKYNRINYNKNLQTNMQNAEIKFESEKNMLRIRQLENETKLQKKNKQLGYIISAILFLITVFIYISFYYRKRYYRKQAENLKQQQINNELKLDLLEKDTLEHLLEKLSLERRFLRSQMDPHFIFNALGNIQSVILQGDKTKAVRYLSKFAKLTRDILDHSRKESVTLEEEIETLASYIGLQQLRLHDSFDYEFIFRDGISMHEQIPPLLIQPLVENAIEHGLKPLENRRGKLKVTFEKASEDTLTCIVEDNGIGIEASKKRQKISSHLPLATEITHERLALYPGIEKDPAISCFHIESNENGCTVTINIPLL